MRGMLILLLQRDLVFLAGYIVVWYINVRKVYFKFGKKSIGQMVPDVWHYGGKRRYFPFIIFPH